MKQKHGVHMLPANEITNILMGKKSGGLMYNEKLHGKEIPEEGSIIQYQHIYFTSDEEIKEGDWCVCYGEIEDNKEHGVTIGDKMYVNPLTQRGKNDTCTQCKKIVATTDPDLIHNCDYMAVIPQDFIERFIKNYNAGIPITEVMLEIRFDEDTSKPYGELGQPAIVFLKLRKDNTVICSPIEKRLFTEDDMRKAASWGWRQAFGDKTTSEFEDWLQENYPK